MTSEFAILYQQISDLRKEILKLLAEIQEQLNEIQSRE